MCGRPRRSSAVIDMSSYSSKPLKVVAVGFHLVGGFVELGTGSGVWKDGEISIVHYPGYCLG